MQSSPRIEELRQKFHENPRRYFAPLANEYRKAGDPEQAIAICRAHLAQQPGHMSGHVVYGQALYDAGRVDEANTVFRQALALDPENMIVLRHLGDIARQRGEVDEARSWYSRALDGDPQDAEVAAYLAELTEPLSVPATETVTEVAAQASPVEEPRVEQSPAEAPVAAASQMDDSPYLEDEFTVGEDAPSESSESPAAVSDVQPDAPFQTEEIPEPIEFEAAQPAVKDVSPIAADVEDRGYRSTPEYESSPIVTRTLAELYLEQGYLEPALEIYRQLAERDPYDSGLQEKITQLSADLNQSAPLDASTEAAPVTTDLMEEAAGAGEAIDTPQAEAPAEIETTDLWDTADSWGDGLFEDVVDTSDSFQMSEIPQASESQYESQPVNEDQVLHEPPFQHKPRVEHEPPAKLQPDDDEFFGLPSDEDGASFMSSFMAPKEEHEPPRAVTPAVEVPAEENDELDIPSRVAEAAEAEPVPEPEPEPEAEHEPEPEREIAQQSEPQAAVTPEAPSRGITIREFFATLGSMRPPAINGEDAFTSLESSSALEEEQPGQSPEIPGDKAEYPYADDAFASLFEDAPVSVEDSRAAAALSSAVAHNPPSPIPTPPEQRAANKPDSSTADQGMRESEDDIRRFREWLDGLANS
ncbi:MAG TPA: tetratricopeptide repeat protein [Gemmatimonadaceae bacterium]|nr:tetratricopeptide repeat protein [Gemmatimonadaceae bacterium]